MRTIINKYEPDRLNIGDFVIISDDELNMKILVITKIDYNIVALDTSSFTAYATSDNTNNMLELIKESAFDYEIIPNCNAEIKIESTKEWDNKYEF